MEISNEKFENYKRVNLLLKLYIGPQHVKV